MSEFGHDANVDEAGGFAEEVGFPRVFGVKEHGEKGKDFAWHRDLHGPYEHGEVRALWGGDLVGGLEGLDEGLDDRGRGGPEGVAVAADLEGLIGGFGGEDGLFWGGENDFEGG